MSAAAVMTALMRRDNGRRISRADHPKHSERTHVGLITASHAFFAASLCFWYVGDFRGLREGSLDETVLLLAGGRIVHGWMCVRT